VKSKTDSSRLSSPERAKQANGAGKRKQHYHDKKAMVIHATEHTDPLLEMDPYAPAPDPGADGGAEPAARL